MTSEEKVANAIKFEIESAKLGKSSARSTLSKVLKTIADENGVSLSAGAADAVAQIAVLTFLKEVVENEKSLAHIQLEKDYAVLKKNCYDAEEKLRVMQCDVNKYTRICREIKDKEAELAELNQKCAEYEEIRKLKSTDARLYGARCAYEFAYQKSKDERTALKSFNSYLLGNGEDGTVEEFEIGEIQKPEKKSRRLIIEE